MATFDPDTREGKPAICPRQLLDEGPACRALVLAAQADEHDRYHDRLDQLLQDALDGTGAAVGVEVVPWPARQTDDVAGL